MKSTISIGCLIVMLCITATLPESSGQQPDSSSLTTGETSGGKHPIPFPSGYDFQASPEKLQKMIAERNISGTRSHGWYLWAGINQPTENGWPIWRSWYITTQVFAPRQKGTAPSNGLTAEPKPGQTVAAPGASLKTLNAQHSPPPIDYPLPVYTIPDVIRKKYKQALDCIAASSKIPDGDNFQNNGDLMLVSEAFTTPAYQFIREQKLYQRSKLRALKRQGNQDIPDLPPCTIVLKHMYWPVKQDGLTALPIWDHPKSIGSYTGFEIQSQWKRAVAIDPSRKVVGPDETAKVEFLYGVKQPDDVTDLGPNTYPDAKIVSIHDFYFKQITQTDYDALSTYDKVLLDLSFYWTHQRPFQVNDYVVSVASHIITKEIPQWTLQTAWWHDQPNEGKFAADRPEIPQAKGPWRHYLLTSEYGIPLKSDTAVLPVVYNPYIELASHPITTNCRNCHIRAAWKTSSYLKLPVPPNPDTTADIQFDNEIFEGLMRTDFLWTIPGRAINKHSRRFRVNEGKLHQ